MARSMYLCLEWIIPARDPESTLSRCHAYAPGEEQTLGVTADGVVVYSPTVGLGAALELGAEGELLVHRVPGAASVAVERFGRVQELAPDERVEVFGGDEVVLAQRCRFRVFPHGVVSLDVPGEPLKAFPSRQTERTRPEFKRPDPVMLRPAPPQPMPPGAGQAPLRPPPERFDPDPDRGRGGGDPDDGKA